MAELRYSQTVFFTVPSNFIYDSKAYDLMKLYSKTSHSESGRNLGLPLLPSSFGLHETQKQQDEILDSPRVLISLSNTRDENKLNLLGRKSNTCD